MNKIFLRTIAVAFAIILAMVLAFIYSQNTAVRRTLTCSGLDVSFADEYNFVTRDEVARILEEDYGAYTGQRLDSVDLFKIEKVLEGKSAILGSEAYTTKDGILHVIITQRRPVVRFQKGSKGFYADREGFLFPLQGNYTSKVPVIDGAIPIMAGDGYKGEPATGAEKEWLGKVIRMINYMVDSKVWANNIVQITVGQDGDMVMVPRNGKERFIFGKPEKVESKFRRMDDYYKSIVPSKGEGFYSTVNVKFDGQIVCRK